MVTRTVHILTNIVVTLPRRTVRTGTVLDLEFVTKNTIIHGQGSKQFQHNQVIGSIQLTGERDIWIQR